MHAFKGKCLLEVTVFSLLLIVCIFDLCPCFMWSSSMLPYFWPKSGAFCFNVRLQDGAGRDSHYCSNTQQHSDAVFNISSCMFFVRIVGLNFKMVYFVATSGFRFQAPLGLLI